MDMLNTMMPLTLWGLQTSGYTGRSPSCYTRCTAFPVTRARADGCAPHVTMRYHAMIADDGAMPRWRTDAHTLTRIGMLWRHHKTLRTVSSLDQFPTMYPTSTTSQRWCWAWAQARMRLGES